MTVRSGVVFPVYSSASLETNPSAPVESHDDLSFFSRWTRPSSQPDLNLMSSSAKAGSGESDTMKNSAGRTVTLVFIARRYP